MTIESKVKSQCSCCGGAIEDHRYGQQRYCLKCHAAYMRAHRPKHRDLPPLARKKANARSYAHVYRDRGLIDRKPCVICGSVNSQMHHEDYNKPTDVVWICRPCHLDYHRMQEELPRLLADIEFIRKGKAMLKQP